MYLIKRIFLLSFVFLLSFGHIGAYYNPGNPTGFVNDYAKILSQEDKLSLENKLSEFERASKNEISVVIVPNMGGDYIENFAVKLFEDWKIGKADKDNGILILVSIEEREMRIEVGYGLEGALTDGQASWIIRNIMSPAFREGNYFAGISDAVSKIIEATKGEHVLEFVPEQQSDNSDDVLFNLFFVGLIFFGLLKRSILKDLPTFISVLVGAILGFGLGYFVGKLIIAIIWAVIFSLLGFTKGTSWFPVGHFGGGGGFGGGGFGGFGGGGSGGGGSSGRW